MILAMLVECLDNDDYTTLQKGDDVIDDDDFTFPNTSGVLSLMWVTIFVTTLVMVNYAYCGCSPVLPNMRRYYLKKQQIKTP